jgi:signal transduction histidine kinase
MAPGVNTQAISCDLLELLAGEALTGNLRVGQSAVTAISRHAHATGDRVSHPDIVEPRQSLLQPPPT